jgi:phage baseplate assembly protein W
MPKELLHPFATGPDGSLATTADPDKQVRQRVFTLLGTEPGERVMLSDYGVETRSSLFEPGDELIAERLAEETRLQMDRYEPGVLVNSVVSLPSPAGSGMAKVAIDYTRREAPTTPFGLARQSNVAVIGVGGTVTEVIHG